ncbi:MAG TPA: sulfurtransferase TusA family protein [Candidatus Lokiarchaeia archaeon]|nr:sulfurtransferase TusA family protein [Candidatus Lokiarchaeia archaeon]
MQDDVTPRPDKTLDLKGKVCPMNFVYTKIALEEMEVGQILEILLDYEPSFTNVPRSVKLQKLGTVIHEQMDGDIKTLWIEKR